MTTFFEDVEASISDIALLCAGEPEGKAEHYLRDFCEGVLSRLSGVPEIPVADLVAYLEERIRERKMEIER